MHPPNEQEREALDAVVARAETDLAFRQQLLTDPRRAIYEGFGVRIPDEFRIRFVERDPDVDALVVLPDFRAAASAPPADELSDADLEQVTGGAHAHNAHLAWKGALKPPSSQHHVD